MPRGGGHRQTATERRGGGGEHARRRQSLTFHWVDPASEGTRERADQQPEENVIGFEVSSLRIC